MNTRTITIWTHTAVRMPRRLTPVALSMLFDPGPPKDLNVVLAKVASVIGSVRQLDYVFLNHQDPDVASNVVWHLVVSNGHWLVISEEL